VPKNLNFKYDRTNLYKYKAPKDDIKTDDLQYEKGKVECTFAPDLITKNYFRDDEKLVNSTTAARA